MFDYQVSKHPHFDEACRAFALRHNLVQLAERAGMNVQILRNKLNPSQPHLLTAPEIWLLTDLTEDSTLVDGFLAQIHCLPCVPINEVAKEKLPHYVMSATAEIGRVAAGAVLGVYADGITHLAPSTPYDNWNGSEWITDEKMQKNEQVKAAEQKKSALLAGAKSTISLWQTELQLGIIRDEDKVKLITWMHYIRDLQAIKTSEAPDVFWPEEPELA